MKGVKSGKVVGPDHTCGDMEMSRGQGSGLFNIFLVNERVRECLRIGGGVKFFKNKSDVQSCSN